MHQQHMKHAGRVDSQKHGENPTLSCMEAFHACYTDKFDGNLQCLQRKVEQLKQKEANMTKQLTLADALQRQNFLTYF